MKFDDEQFISDEELERIRKKRLKELIKKKEKKLKMVNKPTPLTDADFDKEIAKHSLALIDFWAPWCGPCRALAPTIEEIAKENSEKIFVGKLNVDENPATAERFQIYSIPTIVIIKNGQEVDRIVGCVPKNHILTKIKCYME